MQRPRLTNPADGLAGLSRTLLEGLDDPVLAPFLTEWPEPDAERRQMASRSLPVLRWLGGLPSAAVATTRPLVDRLVATAGDLAWGQTYSAADLSAGFLDRYGWSELIGLRGSIASDRIACGVLLLGPGIEYPPHSHAAEEIYLPLSGTALWLRGGEDWRQRRPGELIHHSSGIPHGMRTGVEPLLALYLWRGGDLAEKSNILGSGPEGGIDGDA